MSLHLLLVSKSMREAPYLHGNYFFLSMLSWYFSGFILPLVAGSPMIAENGSFRLELQSGNDQDSARIAVNGLTVLTSDLDAMIWRDEWGPIKGNATLWNAVDEAQKKIGHYFVLATTKDTTVYPEGFKLGIYPLVEPCDHFVKGLEEFLNSVEPEGIVALGTAFRGNLACKDWTHCGTGSSVCTKAENAKVWNMLQYIGSTIPADGPGLREGDRYLILGPKCPQVHAGAMIERFMTNLDPRRHDGKPVGGWTWHGFTDFDISRFWLQSATSSAMKPVIFQVNTNNTALTRCEQPTPLFYVFITSICASFLLPCCLLWSCRRALVKGDFHQGQWYVAKNDIGQLIRRQNKRDLKRRKELNSDVDQDIILFPPCTDADQNVDTQDYKADTLTVWYYKNSDMLKHGPYSNAEMREHVAQGRVKARTKIRLGSWKEFCPLTSVFPRAKLDMCHAFSEKPVSEIASPAVPPSGAPSSYQGHEASSTESTRPPNHGAHHRTLPSKPSRNMQERNAGSSQQHDAYYPSHSAEHYVAPLMNSHHGAYGVPSTYPHAVASSAPVPWQGYCEGMPQHGGRAGHAHHAPRAYGT